MEQQYNSKSPAVKRLMREAQELSEPTSDYYAQPLSDNLFEWHFTVRGPADSDFEGGIYHGRILLPAEYPMKPPNIIILTPNGRFETGKKICLSISGHHPETWQPSWSIRTALLALIGFMPTPGQGTIGAVEYPPEERRKLAKKSVGFCCDDCCCEGKSVADFLKVSESSNNTAEEDKELVKRIAFKESDDDVAQPVKEETEEEKIKRERKEASKRAQDRFRQRILERTCGSGSFLSTPNQTSNSSRARPNPQQVQPQEILERQNIARNENETNNGNWFSISGMDLLISFIIIIIAVLLFRRFGPVTIDDPSRK